MAAEQILACIVNRAGEKAQREQADFQLEGVKLTLDEVAAQGFGMTREAARIRGRLEVATDAETAHKLDMFAESLLCWAESAIAAAEQIMDYNGGDEFDAPPGA